MLSEASIDQLIDGVIRREGGYVNNPADPGGETKYGISKRAHPGEDIRNLTRERAREIYRQHYVVPFRIAEINDSRVAEYVLDWVVHSGAGAIRSIQRQLNLQTDGIVGPATLWSLNNLEDPRTILRWRLYFFISLAPRHAFLRGWVNRLFDLGL